MTEEVKEETQESEVQDVAVQEVEQKQTQEIQRQEQQSNWEKAREALKSQQLKIAELEERLVASQRPVPQEEPDEFADLDPEDYMTVAKARQMAEKIAVKKATEAAKKEVQEYVKQQTIQNDETRCRSKFEDYDYVMENYAIPLIKNDPALAYKIQNSKNPAETAYKLGKLSDDYEEATVKQSVSPKAEKVLKNTQRPISGNAIGSPLKTQADSFSKMSPQQVWEMSQKFARQA
jgi:hypothetical protein